MAENELLIDGKGIKKSLILPEAHFFMLILRLKSAESMILLSFDIEEFDVPREHGVDIPMEEQVRLSTIGTHRILDCLKAEGVKATFFCTANFAQRSPEVVHRIVSEGHELASHGFYHWTFEVADLKKSKEALEQVSGVSVHGYRQARMMPVPESAIAEAGYRYNSSLNPTFIPGRYMHLSAPRTYFMKEGVWQIPASVTPLVRFPLFWLALHNLPYTLYLWLCRRTHRKDGYLVTYFHPWEFLELKEMPELKMPFIIRNHSGQALYDRLSRFIRAMRKEKIEFETFTSFVNTLSPS